MRTKILAIISMSIFAAAVSAATIQLNPVNHSGSINDGSIWVGGVAPSSSDVVKFGDSATTNPTDATPYNFTLSNDTTLLGFQYQVGGQRKYTISSDSYKLTLDRNNASAGSILWHMGAGAGTLAFDCDVIIGNSKGGGSNMGSNLQGTYLNFNKSLTINSVATMSGNTAYKVNDLSLNSTLNINVFSANGKVTFSGTSSASNNSLVNFNSNAGQTTSINLMSEKCLSANKFSSNHNHATTPGMILNWNADDALGFVGSDAKFSLGNANTVVTNKTVTNMTMNMNGYDQKFGMLELINGGDATRDSAIHTFNMLGGAGGSGSELIFEDSSGLESTWLSSKNSVRFTNWNDDCILGFIINDISDPEGGLTLGQRNLLKFYSDAEGTQEIAADWKIATIEGVNFLYMGIIPEASEIAILCGLISLGFAAYRRRR